MSKVGSKTVLIGFVIIAFAIVVSAIIISNGQKPTTISTITTTSIPTTVTTRLAQLTRFIASASCDKTLGKLSLSIRNNVGKDITLETITISTRNTPPEVVSIDPNVLMPTDSEKTYSNISSSCPDSVGLEVKYNYGYNISQCCYDSGVVGVVR